MGGTAGAAVVFGPIGAAVRAARYGVRLEFGGSPSLLDLLFARACAKTESGWAPGMPGRLEDALYRDGDCSYRPAPEWAGRSDIFCCLDAPALGDVGLFWSAW